MSEYIAGITINQLKTSLAKFWALKCPEDYLVSDTYDAREFITPEAYVNKEVLINEIIKLFEFHTFLNEQFNYFLTGSKYCNLDNDDVRKFAKLAIKNIPNYEVIKQDVKSKVAYNAKKQKEKISKQQIKEAKRILKKAKIKTI